MTSAIQKKESHPIKYQTKLKTKKINEKNENMTKREEEKKRGHTPGNNEEKTTRSLGVQVSKHLSGKDQLCLNTTAPLRARLIPISWLEVTVKGHKASHNHGSDQTPAS